ncbi:MAG: ABC transporter permease [Firmicutes bacterium]|nr:ABC transporter permease [Bacillota bacterium]
MRLTTMQYFLAEGWKSARRNVSLISLGTMAVSIFVLGVFGLILMNLSNVNSCLRSSIEIRVYVEDNLTGQGLGALKRQIESIDGVDRVTYVSKDEGLNRLTRQLGEKAGLVDILGENPLPDAYDVRVFNADDTPDIASRISDMPHVIGVNYGQGFTEKLLATTRVIAITALVLAIVLLGAVMFIVGNTVRLSLVARAQEIEVMKLVGATDWFIMWPFLIEGMIVGFMGSSVSGICLYAGYQACIGRLGLLAPFIPVVAEGAPVARFCIGLVVLGVIMGVLAGGVFIRKHLEI